MINTIKWIVNLILLVIATFAEIIGVFSTLALVVYFCAPLTSVKTIMLPLMISSCIIGGFLSAKFMCR